MATFKIIGGKPLKGTVTISGRKNAALPILAASLLTSGKVTIKNLPHIGDVKIMLKLLQAFGAQVSETDNQTIIQTKEVLTSVLPDNLAKQLRGSILFLGPLVARTGSVNMPHPGGCIIGKRPVGLHFDVLETLGSKIKVNTDNTYTVTTKRGLVGKQFFLTEASVTASENAIMAAVIAHGTTELVNVATEGHVVQTAEFLQKLGYQISGLGSSILKIEGSAGKLSTKNIEIEIIPDEIEIGTFITAAVVTQGNITLQNCGDSEINLPIRAIFDRFGVRTIYNKEQQSIIIRGPHKLMPTQVVTGTWPSVPTDLQPPLALLATQVNGNTLIHDWMFEGRFAYVASLEKMGANILNCDPHRILITGPTKLTGTSLVSPDLRAGITQLIAALTAKGESMIEHAELIDRGYANIVERLQALGANIERIAD